MIHVPLLLADFHLVGFLAGILVLREFDEIEFEGERQTRIHIEL